MSSCSGLLHDVAKVGCHGYHVSREVAEYRRGRRLPPLRNGREGAAAGTAVAWREVLLGHECVDLLEPSRCCPGAAID
jgi:hypothetical protein